jgi:hypothetical protein
VKISEGDFVNEQIKHRNCPSIKYSSYCVRPSSTFEDIVRGVVCRADYSALGQVRVRAMAEQRQLLRILRAIDNRLCADCDSTLGTTKVYFSLDHKVWVCSVCHDGHKICIPAERFKSSQEEWSASEVELAGSCTNISRNQLLERYLMHGWPKITKSSSIQQRLLWIRAKYESRLFEFPLQHRENIGFMRRGLRARVESSNSEDFDTLPARVAEIVAVMGPKKPRQYSSSWASKRISEIELIPGIVSCLKGDDNTFNKIPDLVGHCVFPLGLRLSSTEIEPTTFSFVLTNESRVKVYGATLHFSEMIEPEELESLVGPEAATALTATHPVLYVPRALTILSYYPFFHLFHEALAVFYHISLSNSPLPLERYMYNLLREVPLPPEGVAQVIYPLPDRILQIARPPSNKLPMTDFSYLPLFMSLSLDNIITVFRCLCSEQSVCILSNKISLLTPVQEALLSFLFPMQWQGCYIPVMPMHMTDILEAPVPILVGLHSSYLQKCPVKNRPGRVVFVDLDKNALFLGSNVAIGPDSTFLSFHSNGQEDNVVIPQIQKAVYAKLKGRLEECAGSFFATAQDIERTRRELAGADRAYTDNEHLIPMNHFYDNAHSVNVHSTSADFGQWFSTQSIKTTTTLKSTASDMNLNKKRDSSLGSAGAQGTRRGSTMAGISSVFSAGSLGRVQDPANNRLRDGWFDSVEIRQAFLRVFIKVIGDYRDFMINRPNSPFNGEAFLASQQNDPFAKQLYVNNLRGLISELCIMFSFSCRIETQMFTKFIEEDAEEHSEKKYYIESVSKKKNRSVLSTFKKGTTPFLDDTR